MTAQTWTFDGYWNTVLGTGTAAQVAHEHELVAAGLDEWLGAAETEAWAAGGHGGDLPEEWRNFHGRALDALRLALQSEPSDEIVVVWGRGEARTSAVREAESDTSLVPYTTWYDPEEGVRELQGHEWVVAIEAYEGFEEDLDRDQGVVGYHTLTQRELREWRGKGDA